MEFLAEMLEDMLVALNSDLDLKKKTWKHDHMSVGLKMRSRPSSLQQSTITQAKTLSVRSLKKELSRRLVKVMRLVDDKQKTQKSSGRQRSRAPKGDCRR